MIIDTIKASKKYIHKINRQENKRRSQQSIAWATYNKGTGYHQILLPYHVNCKTHLHELAHCYLGHCIDDRTRIPLHEYIEQELSAEIWAYEKCNKTVSIESLINIGYSAFEYCYSVSYIFNQLIIGLKKQKYILDKNQRSYLWHELKYVAILRKQEINRDS